MEKESLLEGVEMSDEHMLAITRKTSLFNRWKSASTFLALLLLASLVVNVKFWTDVWKLRQVMKTKDVSAHVTYISSSIAGLTSTVIDPYYAETAYSNTSEQVQADNLWYNIDIDKGVIALSDSYAAAHELAPAQRFPWDASKGVYIIHGYHNLHCLKIIYLSHREHRLGLPQSRAWPHVSHCFDALRRQVMCDADDTPRAVLRSHDGVSGWDEYRQCRNWSRLEHWAAEHTACYRRPNVPDPGTSNIDKYKHCPEENQYTIPSDRQNKIV